MAEKKITPKAPEGEARSNTGAAAGVTKTQAKKVEARSMARAMTRKMAKKAN